MGAFKATLITEIVINNQKRRQPTMCSKRNYDWFQTEGAVTLCVRKCDLSLDDVLCTYTDDVLTLSAGGEAFFTARLAHPVKKEKFTLQVTPRKVELQMPKATHGRWERLESGAPEQKKVTKTKVDWTKLEKEVEEEEKAETDDGDTGMHKALQALYKCSDPDAQRAMMKSYTESGGTVLNMNWEEVSKKKIEPSPPNGMEHRKYDR